MKLTNHFEAQRFWLLLKLEFARSRSAVMMTLVIIFGLMFILGTVLDLIVNGNRALFEHRGNYAFALNIGGFILSSLAFSDLSNTLKSYRYLTLPVSTFEKFLSMWLFTSVGWLVVITVTFKVYTLIVNPVGHLLFPQVEFETFTFFTSDYAINAVKVYFILQGVFLVGSVHYRGYALAKTLFTLVIFILALGITAYFIMRGSFFLEHECNSAGECEILNEAFAHPAWKMLMWILFWLFAPLCWVIGYIGLKEREI